MSEPTYWIRLGTRTEGPLSLSEVRLRATRGALTRLHMVSRDRTQWCVASKASDIFRSDGSVCSELLSVAPLERRFMVEYPDDEGEPLLIQLPGIAMVRAEWILVPAWIVIAVAALLPTVRDSTATLRAWDLMQLVDGFGWRGALLGVLWLVMLLIAATALGMSTLSKGRVRAISGLVFGSLAVLIAAVALWSGAGTGFLAATLLVLAFCAVRLLDATLFGRSTIAFRMQHPAITLGETAIGLSLSMAALLIAIVGVVLKGVPFLVTWFFVVVAAVTCSVGAVFAAGEVPKRTAILWLAMVTLVAVVLAVLAEAITAYIMGAPRMALFEAVRALSITALASICAYVSYCELRFIQPSTHPAPDQQAHTPQDSTP